MISDLSLNYFKVYYKLLVLFLYKFLCGSEVLLSIISSNGTSTSGKLRRCR